MAADLSAAPTMMLFAAQGGPSSVEQAVAGVQLAAALDTVAAALDNNLCDRIIVATNAGEMIRQVSRWPVTVAADGVSFHFGTCLRQLIHQYGVARALYIGAGSTALFGPDDLRVLCRQLAAADHAVIANNFWSADFVGFVPALAIDAFEPPAIDNNLPFLLNRMAGLAQIDLPRTAATQFDIDTPTDLLILAAHGGARARVREALDELHMDTSRVTALGKYLTDQDKEVVVTGRVGSAAWAFLEAETACRIRMFSEERGMRAAGRDDRGEARSLLGFYLRRFGARGLFAALAELGDAAIIDSRVIFAHMGWALSAADRFNSDLLNAEAVAHPQAREFTRAARAASIPVILGGHSLVSGGLLALVEGAWLHGGNAPASFRDRSAGLAPRPPSSGPQGAAPRTPPLRPLDAEHQQNADHA